MRVRGKRLAVAAAVAAGSLVVVPAPVEQVIAAPPGFVTAAGDDLVLDGQPYRFTGMNVYHANNTSLCWNPMSDVVLQSSFDEIGTGRVIRAWFFQSLATDGGQRDWAAFDRTIAAAASRGMKVIPTLGNQWSACDGPDGGAGIDKTESWYTTDYAAQTQPGSLVPYREWVAEVVARYADDPTVMAWQLMNEAEVKPVVGDGLPCSANADDILRSFASDVSTLVKSIDPDHLVSLGTIGGGQCGTSFEEYAFVHDLPTIDVCEYHDYGPAAESFPGDEFNGLQKRIDQCDALDKPLIIGESGIRPVDAGGTFDARAEAFRTKLTDQLGAGIDGVALWAWNPAGSTLGDFDIGPADPVLAVLADVLAAPVATVTLQGVVTDGGVPVDQAAVTVRVPGTGDVVAQTLSDPTGFYVLTLQAGTYDVVATDGVRSRLVAGFSVPVSRTLDLALTSPFVTVSGTFVDADGSPVPNGELRLGCGAAFSDQVTGADGRFSFQVVAGTSECFVSAFDPRPGRIRSMRTSASASSIDLSSDLELDFQPATVPFDVTVENPDGSPADVVAISTSPATGLSVQRARYSFQVGDWESTRLGVSSAQFSVVPASTVVQVQLANGATLRQTVDASVESSVSFTASTPSVVSGTLSTPSGAPAATGRGWVDCGAGVVEFAMATDGSFSQPVAPAPACSVLLQSWTSADGRLEQLDMYASPVDLSSNVDLDLTVPTVGLSIDVVDGAGLPATNVSRIVIEPESTPTVTTATGPLTVARWFIMQFGSASVSLPTIAGRTTVNVFLDDGQVVQQVVDTSVQTSVTIALVPPSMLTMQVRTPYGEPAWGGSVTLNCPGLLRFLSIDFNGRLDYPVSPRSGCNVSTSVTIERDGHRSEMQLNFGAIDLTSDVHLDAVVPHTQQVIDVVNADGSPADVDRIDVEPWVGGGQVATAPPASAVRFRTTQFSSASASLPALPGDNRVLEQLGNGAVIERQLTTPVAGGHATLVLSNPPLWLNGAPGSTNDGDSVSDLVEAMAPNNGDGNGDGVPDYEQANVTSYPSSAGNYVTLVAPAGTTLGNVRTVDPATYSLPPQLVLPEGLTDFRVDGVAPGSDATLTIYTSSSAAVIAYVKYQDGALKILPFDRFTKFADRVEIRLTDGGPGDDDGVANGVIVDPGGVATAVPLVDEAPPTLTGAVSPAPNAAGWHRGPVTVDWQAVDPEPSSGAASDPTDTLVTAEGADQTVVSGESCDAAVNCATGSVRVSIDVTPPVVTVARSAAGVTTCEATDALSGVADGCTVDDPQQVSPGVFSVSASATDAAGNTGMGSVTYTVPVTVSDRATVQAWIDQLAGLSLNRREARIRDEALTDLRKVAASRNWTTAGAVRRSAADDVMEDLGDVAKELARITGSPVPAQVNAAMVAMTRRWAVDAIASAPSRGVRPNRVAQARQSLTQGDRHAAEGRPAQAMDAYTKAYERVTDD